MLSGTGGRAAAAALAASGHYPLRGAATWKSTVGTNVASDALSNLSSVGVKGATRTLVTVLAALPALGSFVNLWMVLRWLGRRSA